MFERWNNRCFFPIWSLRRVSGSSLQIYTQVKAANRYVYDPCFPCSVILTHWRANGDVDPRSIMSVRYSLQRKRMNRQNSDTISRTLNTIKLHSLSFWPCFCALYYNAVCCAVPFTKSSAEFLPWWYSQFETETRMLVRERSKDSDIQSKIYGQQRITRFEISFILQYSVWHYKSTTSIKLWYRYKEDDQSLELGWEVAMGVKCWRLNFPGLSACGRVANSLPRLLVFPLTVDIRCSQDWVCLLKRRYIYILRMNGWMYSWVG